MGRSVFGDDENGVKKGPWTVDEDQKLVDHIRRHGHGSWRALPKLAGLNRCGKSCRLRWTNYLRPDIKRGKFSDEEEQLIINLHSVLGNKWSTIATHLPGRTDNEIKNFWNTHLRKKLLQMGVDPITHGPRADLCLLLNLPHLLAINPINVNVPPSWDINALIGSHLDTAQQQQVAKIQWLQNMLQVLSSTSAGPLPSTTPTMESHNLLGSHHDVPPLLDQQHLCGSSYQLERLGGFGPNPLLQNIPSTFPNHDHHQLIDQNPKFECFTDYNNNVDIINAQSNVLPTANSIPALVSASPERCGFSQMENKVNPTDHHHHPISYPSSTSATYGSWGELADDEAADQSYWRDIIDQAYSSFP